MAKSELVDLIICGGESGPDARPLRPDSARDLRDQCVSAGVKFLFKQWGEYRPFDPNQDKAIYADNIVSSGWHPETDTIRVGEKKAGRLLDGKIWNEFPEIST